MCVGLTRKEFNVKIGIDIIELSFLKKRLEHSPIFIEKILSLDERADTRIEKYAGKIAAKEAIIKTGYMKAGQWHRVQILNKKSGAPSVFDETGKEIKKLQISIAHSPTYAVAVAVYNG